jgi:molecular chaperone GrpE
MSEQDTGSEADGSEPEPETDTEGSTGDPAVDIEQETDGELVERLREADPEQVATEIRALRERAEAAESDLADHQQRVEELEESLKRKQAEFQNYKKRTERRREEERERATEELVERLLPVRDDLARALDTDESADIREGVESTLRRFDDALDAEGVERIDPEPGQEVDPSSHQVLMRVDSEHPEGHIDDVHRPGYEMGGKVIRTAQVIVAGGDAEGDADAEE